MVNQLDRATESETTSVCGDLQKVVEDDALLETVISVLVMAATILVKAITKTFQRYSLV